MAEFLPPVIAELGADITQFKAKMLEARAEMAKTTSEGQSNFSKFAQLGKGAMLGVGAAAVAVAGLSVKLADQWEKSHARLQTAVVNSGHKMSEFDGQIKRLDSSFTKYGYSADQTEGALARLTQATNDPEKAIRNLGLAADLAAARHMDLESSANLVGMVLNGNTARLKRMGIDLGTATGGVLGLHKAQDALAKAQENAAQAAEKLSAAHGKGAQAAKDHYAKALEAVQAAQKKVNDMSGAGGQAIAALSQRFGGSAAAQSKTFGGELKNMEASLKNVGIAIGTKLIPVLKDLMDWVTKHKTEVMILAGVIGTTLVAAMVAATAAWVAANLAFVATPLGAIIVGILAVAAAAVYLWTNWDQVWNFIKNNPAYAVVIALVVGLVAPILLVVAAARFLYSNWDAIWTFVQDKAQVVWNVIGPLIMGIWHTIMDVVHLVSDIIHGDWSKAWDDLQKFVGDAIGTVIQWFIDLPGKLLDALGKVLAAMFQFGADLVHKIIDGIGSVASGIGGAIKGAIGSAVRSIPGVGGPVANFLGLAGGGLMAAGVPYLVGEKGPEIVMSGTSRQVVPTGQLADVVGGGGHTFNNTFVTNADAHEIAREIAWQLKTA